MLRGRITPNGTSIAGIQRIQRFVVNGSDIKTSGLDYAANYSWSEIFGGALSIGLRDLSVGIQVGGFCLSRGNIPRKWRRFCWTSNEGVPFTPLPEIKTSLYIKWENNHHRLTMLGGTLTATSILLQTRPNP